MDDISSHVNNWYYIMKKKNNCLDSGDIVSAII